MTEPRRWLTSLNEKQDGTSVEALNLLRSAGVPHQLPDDVRQATQAKLEVTLAAGVAATSFAWLHALEAKLGAAVAPKALFLSLTKSMSATSLTLLTGASLAGAGLGLHAVLRPPKAQTPPNDVAAVTPPGTAHRANSAPGAPSSVPRAASPLDVAPAVQAVSSAEPPLAERLSSSTAPTPLTPLPPPIQRNADSNAGRGILNPATPAVKHATPSPLPPRPPSATDALLSEARELAAIRQLSNAEERISRLRELAARYPAGQLVAEREVLLTQSLFDAQRPEACQRAAKLLERNPTGPYATRAKALNARCTR